jgi:hypothetical protein
MKYSQRWRQTTLANRLLVITSFLMAVATFCLALASFYHYRTFQAQLTTMQEQADAARKSANIAADQSQAVKDSARAAKDSAASANTLTEQNKELIGAAKTQADASEKSMRLAQNSFRLLERPALGIDATGAPYVEIGKPIGVAVKIRNFGHLPAGNAVVVTTVFLDPVADISAPCPEPKPATVHIGLASKSLIAANADRLAIGASMNLMSADDVESINVRKTLWIYVYLTVRYGDKGQYFLEYYARSNVSTKSWDECGTHNRAN